MKRLLFFWAVLCVGVVRGADNNGIAVSDVKVAREGGQLRLSMKLSVAPGAVTNLQSMALTPTFSHTWGMNARFPYVLVNGRNRAKIYKRHEKFGYESIRKNRPYKVVTVNGDFRGEVIDYEATIPDAEWINQAELSLAFVLSRPPQDDRSYSVPLLVPAAAAKVVEPVVEMVEVDEPVVKTVTGSTALTFAPEVEEEPEKVEQLKAASPNFDAASVGFQIASTTFNPALAGNRHELEKIDETLRYIAGTPGARIVSFTITGYASPEGKYDHNSAIAYGRALALARYIQDKYEISSEVLHVRGVGEDWSGLRAMVMASSNLYRNLVMEVIDAPDGPDTKEYRLRRTLDGCGWKWIQQEFFGRLRRVDFSIDYME